MTEDYLIRLCSWHFIPVEKETMKKDALYKKGMKTRREVLGAGREAAIVREEDDFSMPLRIFTTRYV